MSRTLDYYDQNAERFAADTLDVKFTDIQDRFLGYLAPGALILDFGCGAGRDSRYFATKGFRVEACDGSEEMVRIAALNVGAVATSAVSTSEAENALQAETPDETSASDATSEVGNRVQVRRMMFSELDEIERYDGIFACASILHVPYAEQPDVFSRMRRAVKKGGVIYVSFKYGAFEGERNGRFFTDLDEERLANVLRASEEPYKSEAPDKSEAPGKDENPGSTPELIIIEKWVSGDARPGRGDEKWLNVILRRT